MSTIVENLLADHSPGLDVAAGNAGLWRRVPTRELNRPRFGPTGYFEAFRAEGTLSDRMAVSRRADGD